MKPCWFGLSRSLARSETDGSAPGSLPLGIQIRGLRICTSDLLDADCHRALSIAHEIAAELPVMATSLIQKEKRIVDLCASPDLSKDKLRTEISKL